MYSAGRVQGRRKEIELDAKASFSAIGYGSGFLTYWTGV